MIAFLGQKQLNNEYDGAFYIYNQKIYDKNYSMIIKVDKNGSEEGFKIFEKNENEANNVFNILGLIPYEYVGDLINTYKHPNPIISYVGFQIMWPIKNASNEICSYSNEYVSVKYYDNSGRILYESDVSDNNSNFYYKYESIDEKSYYRYNLLDGGTIYQALGLDARYSTEKIKFYLDNSGQVYKYEYIEKNNITEEEFNELKEEYVNYINENMIDSEEIINTFLKYIKKISDEINIDDNENSIPDADLMGKQNNDYENKIKSEEVYDISGDFKSYLSDEIWVRENLYIKENYFGNVIDSNQKQNVKYTEINNVNTNMCIVITDYEGDGNCSQCSILTFKNGKIQVNKLEDSYGSDKGRNQYNINKDTNSIVIGYAGGGVVRYDIYSISDNDIEAVGLIEMYDVTTEEELTYSYSLNGESCSKQEYEEIKQKYISDYFSQDSIFTTIEF